MKQDHILTIYLVFSFVALVNTTESTIVVDGNKGKDNVSCLLGTEPCASINMALTGLQLSYCTTIMVEPGIYILNHGNETSLLEKDEISIIGSGDNTIIKCNSPSTGIILHSSMNVTIQSIVFEGCGRGIMLDWINFHAAVSIVSCSQVILEDVRIISSNGTGLLLADVLEYFAIEDCFITDSKIIDYPSLSPMDVYFTGGGIILKSINNYNYKYYSYVLNTTIINNDFKAYGKVHCHDFYGGGITLMYSWTGLIIDSCTFLKNTRAFVIQDDFGSTITIENSVIMDNLKNSIMNMGVYDSSYRLINLITNEAMVAIASSLEGSKTNYNPEGLIVEYDGLLGFNVHIEYNSDQYFPLINRESPCEIPSDSNSRGTCSNIGEDYTGHCPSSYSTCGAGICHCNDNHYGRLCGSCEDGYAVAINSPYLSCVPCTSKIEIFKSWAILIGLQFCPLTLMILIIAIFNVNLNQGSLEAYIFLCQILTLGFPSVGYPSWMTTQNSYFIDLNKFSYFLFPLQIWNMDFISILSQHYHYNQLKNNRFLLLYFGSSGYSICISPNTTPIGALSFWYIIAFYPFTVIAIIYMSIALYNKGSRPVVCVIRPVHRLLARLWRMAGLQPSFSHTVASVFTLSFTQLAAISIKLIHPSWYHDESTNKIIHTYFYDGSQDYYSSWSHIMATTFAMLVLIVLTLSVIYLTLYPFKWFQSYFNKVKFSGKQFLISLTEVFMGPYKDGTRDSWDYRYFVGISFLTRLIIMTFYFIPQTQHMSIIIPIMEIIISFLYAATVLVFRPYKRNIHTFTKMITLLILGALSSCYFYAPYFPRNPIDGYVGYWYQYITIPLVGSLIIILVVPYCFVWFIQKFRMSYCYLKPPERNIRSVPDPLEEEDACDDTMQLSNQICDIDQIADRIINPDQYPPPTPPVHRADDGYEELVGDHNYDEQTQGHSPANHERQIETLLFIDANSLKHKLYKTFPY